MPKIPKIASLWYLCNISEKKGEKDEVDFLHADNIKRSYNLRLLILVDMAKHAQITQNKSL